MSFAQAAGRMKRARLTADPEKLTPFQLSLLADLRDHPGDMTVFIAQRVWAASKGWQRSANCGAHGGSTRGIFMAASLGRHLHRLERAGLVYSTAREETRWRPEWRLTQAGKDALAKAQEAVKKR